MLKNCASPISMLFPMFRPESSAIARSVWIFTVNISLEGYPRNIIDDKCSIVGIRVGQKLAAKIFLVPERSVISGPTQSNAAHPLFFPRSTLTTTRASRPKTSSPKRSIMFAAILISLFTFVHPTICQVTVDNDGFSPATVSTVHNRSST
jgi:hypothetical protein